jgi:O-antigen/teichoic acid export membrane protein
MSKAADMAKVSVKGGFHLLWGLVASTVISAVGTIIIAWLLGESNYGIYTIAVTAPNLIATFRDMGINSAMVRYTAQYNAENEASKIRGIFISGLIFETLLGLVLSMVSFLLSGFIATTLFQRPAIAPLIQVASFVILTGALLNTATAAFTGIEKMHLNSIMLVCQSIIKTILIIALVVLGLGPFGAMIGYTAAFLIAGLIGVLLMWTIYKNLPKPTAGRLEIKSNIKIMFRYGLPLSISAILSGFLAQYYAILMAIYVKNDAMIGNYSVAMNFVVLITFFATPVTTMLFPAFSKLDPQKDRGTLKNVFQFSVKYAALLVVPVTAMIIALSQPAISTIFRGSYAEAPLFLALLAIAYLYSAFGSLSTGNLINSQGQTTFNLYLTVLTAAIGFPMSFVLISQFGIIGLITTTLVASIPSLVISLYWLKRRYGVTVDWVSSAKILLSSAIATVLTYALIAQLSFSSWIRLVIGVAIFLLAFITATLLTRTVNRTDIGNLRGMLSALGPLRRLFTFLLNVIEKIMTILRL